MDDDNDGSSHGDADRCTDGTTVMHASLYTDASLDEQSDGSADEESDGVVDGYEDGQADGDDDVVADGHHDKHRDTATSSAPDGVSCLATGVSAD